jgi:Uma2 family endonuclease
MTTRIEPVVTVDDLDLMPDDGNRYEVIEGELFVSRAPGLTHQIIVSNLIGSFRTYLVQNPVGIVVPGPGVIFSEISGVIPDVVFISNGRRGEIASTERVTGAPDLVVEIVSPGAENERRDRVVKRQLYSKYGVKEYWIVYPQTRAIEIYFDGGQGLGLIATLYEQDEITSSTLPGFQCKVESIFLI